MTRANVNHSHCRSFDMESSPHDLRDVDQTRFSEGDEARILALQDGQQTTLAAADQPTDNNDPTTTTTPRRRRRKTKPTGPAPGSRTVAHLTASQLAQKRAHDRKAQRASRERTKSTIEGLERHIRDLESLDIHQELQRVLAERDLARRECEELRARLDAVASVVRGSGVAHRGPNVRDGIEGDGNGDVGDASLRQSLVVHEQNQGNGSLY